MLTFVEPLGLECVAGALEPDGHECLIVDMRIDGESVGMDKCIRFEPAIVGLQCNFTTERNRTMVLARRVREVLPDVFIVVGGHDAARDPAWFSNPVVDCVVVGDGEVIIPALVDAVERGGSLAEVPGIAVNGATGQQHTMPAPNRGPLDELPMPARHLIKDYASEYYINFRKPLALLETARGCPYRCNFCSVWKFHEKTFREKSCERVIQELEQIDAPNVFIVDDIFWLNPRRGLEMAQQLKASGIRKYYTVQTRTDIIVRHPELIEAWAECGDLAIFLGVESVSDEGLMAVNKNNSADNNVRAIKILKDLGVGFTCNFIVDPGWERADFTKLREWIDRNTAYNSGFSVLTPLPGTDLWDSAKGNVTTHDWEMFDLIHTVLPTRLPLEEFYDEYAKLWDWSLQVRYKHRGKAKTYVQMLGALATGKVSFSAIRNGMNIAKVFSDPKTFLEAHKNQSPPSAEMPEASVPIVATVAAGASGRTVAAGAAPAGPASAQADKKSTVEAGAGPAVSA